MTQSLSALKERIEEEAKLDEAEQSSVCIEPVGEMIARSIVSRRRGIG